MTASSLRTLEMLVIEDTPADVVLLNEAVAESRTPATVHVARNGAEAMQFLRREAPFSDAPRPDVIVLDLNLPIKNGQEVLEELMADPSLRTIPVAILTTSSSETHLCELYTRGLCRYFVKTAEFRELQDIVRRIAAHAGAEPDPR